MTALGRARFILLAAALTTGPSAFARVGSDRGGKADAERAIQAYLALWSTNEGVTAASVARFYAPHVVYYGKSMSRADILADKQAYIRRWPSRHYREIPGSFAARCNADRSACKVTAAMAWSRTDRVGRHRSGMATMAFTFVPADGARKIARESAVLR